MTEIKNDELNQASETSNTETEKPIVEEINEPKTKTTIADFLKKCFSKENLKKTIAVILLAAIVIGGVCGVISYNSPKSVARRYAKAVFLCDDKAVAKLTAYDWYVKTLNGDDEDAFFDKKSDYYDADITSWKDYFKTYKSYTKESMEDEFGDYEFSFEVTRVKDISARKLKEKYSDILQEYEEKSMLDSDSIENGKIATVRVKLETEDGIARGTFTTVIVKTFGRWKVLTHDFDFEW